VTVSSDFASSRWSDEACVTAATISLGVVDSSPVRHCVVRAHDSDLGVEVNTKAHPGGGGDSGHAYSPNVPRNELLEMYDTLVELRSQFGQLLPRELPLHHQHRTLDGG